MIQPNCSRLLFLIGILMWSGAASFEDYLSANNKPFLVDRAGDDGIGNGGSDSDDRFLFTTKRCN